MKPANKESPEKFLELQPGDQSTNFLYLGIEAGSPTLQADSLSSEPPEKLYYMNRCRQLLGDFIKQFLGFSKCC